MSKDDGGSSGGFEEASGDADEVELVFGVCVGDDARFEGYEHGLMVAPDSEVAVDGGECGLADFVFEDSSVGSDHGELVGCHG